MKNTAPSTELKNAKNVGTAQEYETALITVWQALGRFAPTDFKNRWHQARAETAYHAAENALYKTGRLQMLENGELMLRCDGL